MSFELSPVQAPQVLSALQGVGTNALVHNPFAFEAVEAPQVLSALQGVGTNALVHNPFAFGQDA